MSASHRTIDFSFLSGCQIKKQTDARVGYEASKSMILLGELGTFVCFKSFISIFDIYIYI